MAESFWKTHSKAVPAGIDSHPWMGILRDTTEIVKPELFMDLEKSGELDDYFRVKLSEALEEYDRMIADGADEQTAKEAVMDSFFPEDPEDDDVEDWETDEAEQEHAAALMRSLGVDMDDIEVDEEDEEIDDAEEDEDLDDPMRMSLQPGQKKMINGVEYTLNENHRWTRPSESSGRQDPGPPNPNLVKQMPGGVPIRGQHSTPPETAKQPAPLARMPGASKPQSAPTNNPQQPAPPADAGATTPFRGAFNPQVEADPNHDGVADRARVGVPAFDVPPPPKKIPRIPGLTGMASKAESHFASEFEKNPEELTDRAIVLFTAAAAAKGRTPTFETDACKLLSPYWNSTDLDSDLSRRSQNRATLNTALHQTANAICKRAFLAHLDTMEAGQEILVTVGGCGAGKGYGLEIDDATGQPRVPVAYQLAQRADVVWDSAGDQNATENPWILQEARKRGLKVSYIYVNADPKVSWADPKRGVVQRATKPENGRMVDAMVFADSYALGAKNHAAFHESHRHDSDVTFMFLQNGNPPQVLNEMPKEALSIDRRELAKFAVDTISQRTDLPEHVRQGALAGTQIWKD